MIGLPKLLLLVVVAVAVWFLWRAIKRRGLVRPSRNPRAPSSAQSTALDMEKCRICGDFVPGDAHACGDARCPYPAA